MQAHIASLQDLEDFNNQRREATHEHMRMDDDGGPPVDFHHPPHPFQEGFQAFTPSANMDTRDVIEACPYKPGTEKAIAWLNGYYNARDSLDYTQGMNLV